MVFLVLTLQGINNSIIHIASSQKTPIRLQEYGVNIFQTISTKSAFKKALRKKLILVNGNIATTATFIFGGEKITYLRPKESVSSKKLILKLDVIHEDDYLAIIHKPAGILVSGNSFKTISNALAQNLQKSSANDSTNPKAVHRLDYPTTGLLLIGKTSSSIIALNRLFEQKKIQKTYYAITIGKMKNAGTIDLEIDGKPSYSTFKLEKTVVSERFEFLNLVKLSPLTGRRHQLRKHLSAIGNPILGDKDYGIDYLILNGKGLYLHAYSLEFVHPFTQEKMLIKKSLPNKFKKIFPESFI